MKKKIAILSFAFVVVALVLMNRTQSMDAQALYDQDMITITTEEKALETFSLAEIEAMEGETFLATFQKKVGPPVENTYTGVPLSTLLKESGVDIEKITGVTVTSLDNFAVDITKEEILEQSHVYLAYQCNEAYLKTTGEKKSGAFMIVMRKEPVATRWARDLVEIQVNIA